MSEDTPRCPDCDSPMPPDGWNEGLCPRCLLQMALEESSEGGGPEDTPAVSAEAAASAPSLSRGRILGSRYGIRKLLGRGGMGEVWRAFDLKLRVEVALKTVRADLAEQERLLETLRQEVRAAREVVSPSVCRVHDLQELDGLELVSMEYVDGTTLRALLEERGPLELQEAREIAAQFLSGLDAIHQAGLVHRDIKPENIMITRTGRVVVMDFGIAKSLAALQSGTVAGTPAYMAPEQTRGEGVDARADVFAAGVVLAEMLAPGGGGRKERRVLWQGIRQEPPQLPESPWRAVIENAVSPRPEQRYAAAAALARALEEVTVRVEGAEDVEPYPGLASFSEENREYFFGRELEAEAVWKKIRHLHMLALVGPSGAGKTSFLRAGLLASPPAGWSHVVCKPGEAPFAALRQALVPQLSGDSEAIGELVKLDDTEAMVSAVSRWRKRSRHALLVVDQLEELFTLSPAPVQAAFAQMLGLLAVEADVHVLLSMRDDFLIRCQAHEALHPILSDLTLLAPPVGAALRRAVVQPALKCGYRFEDEALVDQMLSEVEGERAALPLVAFCAEQLWARRDRERGVLSREAYEVVGGVTGALVQHAELTLERIGASRGVVVRELFRNLYKSQGTRAVRDREELLSVFEQGDARRTATDVLDALIDARLLTSYGVDPAEGPDGAQRIEIVHESLLSSWPRLVRWQSQDVEGAQMRDDLRQAARRWQERDRPDDLLWVGSAFREFQLWQERYPGRFSEIEEAFARAMVAHAGRRRSRRRRAIGMAFLTLVAVSVAMAALWRTSEAARARAVSETLRAEASRLVLLGRAAVRDDTSAALAYALKSLELADSPAARELAVDVLWRGPTRIQVTDEEGRGAGFSQDGRWLARWAFDPQQLEVWPRNGGAPKRFPGEEGAFEDGAFSVTPDAGLVMVSHVPGAEGTPARLLIRSVDDWRLLRTFDVPDLLGYSLVPRRPALEAMTMTSVVGGRFQALMTEWPLVEGEPTELARLDAREVRLLGVVSDPAGKVMAYGARDNTIKVFERDATGRTRARVIGTHDHPLSVGPEGVSIRVHPDADTVASGDDGGEIRLHRISSATPRPIRVIDTGGWSDLGRPEFSPDGSLMAVAVASDVRLWNLAGPPDAEPVLLSGAGLQLSRRSFSPDGRWFVTVQRRGTGTNLWPLAREYPRDLHGHTATLTGLAFDPHGRWIATSSLDNTLRLWPLRGDSGEQARILFRDQTESGFTDIDVDPDGRFVVAGNQHGRVWVIPVDGGPPRALSGFHSGIVGVAVGPKGRLVAAAGGQGPAPDRVVRVWDLESGEVHVLDSGQDRGMDWWFEFTADGRILATEQGGGVRLWNIEDGTSEMLHPGADHLTRGSRLSSVCTGQAAQLDQWLCHDLATGTRRNVDFSSHAGADPGEFALDPAIEWFVSGDQLGAVRVGPISGAPPHLLPGLDRPITELEVSPDGAWVAAGTVEGDLRLWPMPDLDSQPFHLLPREELLDRLRALTNLRAVEDETKPTDYRIEAAPFPGWESVPTW